MRYLIFVLFGLLLGCSKSSDSVSANESVKPQAAINYPFHRYVGPDVVQDHNYPQNVKKIHIQREGQGTTSHQILTFNRDGWNDTAFTFNEGGDTTVITYGYELRDGFLKAKTVTANSIPNVKFNYEYDQQGYLVKEVMTSLLTGVAGNSLVNEYVYSKSGDTTICTNWLDGKVFKLQYEVNSIIVKKEVPYNQTYELYDCDKRKLTVYGATDSSAQQYFTFNEFGERLIENRAGYDVLFTYKFRDSSNAWTLCTDSDGWTEYRQISYY